MEAIQRRSPPTFRPTREPQLYQSIQGVPRCQIKVHYYAVCLTT